MTVHCKDGSEHRGDDMDLMPKAVACRKAKALAAYRAGRTDKYSRSVESIRVYEVDVNVAFAAMANAKSTGKEGTKLHKEFPVAKATR